MLDITQDQLLIIKAILREMAPDCTVYAFGSRTKGTSRTFSDLDLMIRSDAEMDWLVVESLKDAFSDSDLPYTVDVLDWHKCTDAFRSSALGNAVIVSDTDRGFIGGLPDPMENPTL